MRQPKKKSPPKIGASGSKTLGIFYQRVGRDLGLVDGREGRRGRRNCCRRLAFHNVHRERRDDAIRQLVEDVERLEGRDRRHAAGLGLDDEDLLFPVHHLDRGRRAARRAVVRPVRVRAHADAAVLRGTARERRVARATDAGPRRGGTRKSRGRTSAGPPRRTDTRCYSRRNSTGPGA